jgi:hypothetical protein
MSSTIGYVSTYVTIRHMFWLTISLRFLLNADTPFKSDKHFTLIYLSVLDDQFITDVCMHSNDQADA